MLKKKQATTLELFQSRLDVICSPKHPLVKLSCQIDWSFFEEEFGQYYSEGKGRPAKPIRLMVALHYLKHTYNESDESVVDRFVENPYWQYFAGYEYFSHEYPIDPTSLVKWRKRIGSKGVEKLLQGVIMTGMSSGLIKSSHFNKVNVDTTVQEKAISYPTDSKLYHKMREKLVEEAQERGIELRQSYKRLSKSALSKQGRYSHAKQFKRARKETRKLKTYLGRVVRDIRRKVDNPDQELKDLLELADQLLEQEKDSKNKIYSIHAREVECISKGKVHKRYEFGNKVSIVSTSRDNWIIGALSFHGNPYDGHTLDEVLSQVKRLTGKTPREAYCDLGYRGYNYSGETKIQISKRGKAYRNLSRWMRKWMKRRSAIEPIIGHLKSDNRMGRNYLKGEDRRLAYG